MFISALTQLRVLNLHKDPTNFISSLVSRVPSLSRFRVEEVASDCGYDTKRTVDTLLAQKLTQNQHKLTAGSASASSSASNILITPDHLVAARHNWRAAGGIGEWKALASEEGEDSGLLVKSGWDTSRGSLSFRSIGEGFVGYRCEGMTPYTIVHPTMLY